MIYHDGWYYLLATHGSCCRGADSGYNIRVGRARRVTGPFLDHTGVDMLQGGGKLFVGSGGRVIGPGHFGLLDLGDGVQKFSCHYEADLDRGGASVLDIRPLLWKDGWPVAGENFKEGTYEIESVRTGTALELAVEGVPVGGRRVRGGGGAGPAPDRCGWPRCTCEPWRRAGGRRRRHVRRPGRCDSAAGCRAGLDELACGQLGCAHGQLPVPGPAEVDALPPSPTPAATPARPISRSPSPARTARWPRPRTANWSRCPPLPADPNNSGVSTNSPTAPGASCPRSVPTTKEPLALSAIGSSFATLARFNPDSDKQRWLFKTP